MVCDHTLLFHIQYWFFFSFNLTHKTKIGIGKGGKLLIATQSIVDVKLLLFLLLALTYCAKMLGQNYFAKPNQHVLAFLHQKFYCTIHQWNCFYYLVTYMH
jgi:hypothetical protein